MKQLFLSPQLSRLISEAAPIMFPFQAESPLDSQPPPPDGFLDDAQYLEINSMDAHFVSSRGAPSSRCTPELVGSLSLRASDTGQRYSIIHKSSSTVFESATSNLMTDGEVEPRRPLSSHELSDEDQQQPLNIFPLLRLQPSMNLAAAASPTPSQPLSSYKLGIASSRQLRKMKTAASASQRWRSMRGKSQGLKDNTADSAPALAMHGFLSFHHPTSPCASLLATGVTDGQVVGAPGRALGLLYGPSSTVDHMSAESLATRPITRSNTQREAQAVLLIGSAESSPVLRILPRLLEMPLLARLQSKEGEPLVMELLLRGLTDQQVEAFELFVAVVRLFAARHQCVPLIEEVV